jgi:hypothetical protein
VLSGAYGGGAIPLAPHGRGALPLSISYSLFQHDLNLLGGGACTLALLWSGCFALVELVPMELVCSSVLRKLT